MFVKVIILACLAICTVTAEPNLDQFQLAYGAHLLGGINPELYASAKALTPLQYASGFPLVYAAQMLAGPVHKTVKPSIVSAPLQYAATLPVSYGAPTAFAYSSPYPSLTYGAPSPLTYAGPSFHNQPYASYAAAPAHTTLAYGGSSSGLGSGPITFGSSSVAPAAALNYAAFAANAQALGGSPYAAQVLDAAMGRSAADLYTRGVPFAIPTSQAMAATSNGAAAAANAETARQIALQQIAPGYNTAASLGETRAQARADRH
ncbi:cuticle protein 16.5-like isoform X1 [Wyeomyia smithii]|uniref:cuticle protein 16.5-like isoform X1 n=1 Tax=Wyeomyia smithii TaxID=174621 RepID=UPI002468005B|nr:cuticle protein 16.5-like isoform X1 [Wyeomyia smithii]